MADFGYEEYSKIAFADRRKRENRARVLARKITADEN